jgi:hypothetical protein
MILSDLPHLELFVRVNAPPLFVKLNAFEVLRGVRLLFQFTKKDFMDVTFQLELIYLLSCCILRAVFSLISFLLQTVYCHDTLLKNMFTRLQ